MFLVFEPSNLPYAEVLSYLLANANKKINVGLAPLDAVNPLVLHILPTEKDRSKKILIGKCSVSRYFARIASKPLYSSLSLSNQIVVDDVLDNVRNRHISEVLKVINAAEGNYILGSKISLADIIAYDYFKVNPQPKTSETFTNWFNKIDNLPEAVEAAKIIKNALNTSDVNDIFKLKIAEQLSTLSGVDKKTIFIISTIKFRIW
jgi:arginyl-tRNA synthetase